MDAEAPPARSLSLSLWSATPYTSYFTGSRRRRATNPSWMVPGDEARKHTRLASAPEGDPVSRSRFQSDAPRCCPAHDERIVDVWTLRTAALTGRRDLVEKFRSGGAQSPRLSLSNREEVGGGFLTFSFRCRKPAPRRTRTYGI